MQHLMLLVRGIWAKDQYNTLNFFFYVEQNLCLACLPSPTSSLETRQRSSSKEG